jgi:RNA polymerase sigma-70 factor (ECF subfamily)
MPDSEMTGRLFLLPRDAEVPQGAVAAKPEARLVERIAAGDEDAFNELYRMFAPMIHGIVLSRVPRDEADDVVQEVFIAAFKSIGSLRDKNAVGPWLAMIARNRSVNVFRNARPSVELSEDMAHKNNPSSAEANEIIAVIRTLPDAYKETLVLRLVEGMTGPEIARQTGLTHDSVRVNLHRGMKLLRQKLGIEVK